VSDKFIGKVVPDPNYPVIVCLRPLFERSDINQYSTIRDVKVSAPLRGLVRYFDYLVGPANSYCVFDVQHVPQASSSREIAEHFQTSECSQLVQVITLDEEEYVRQALVGEGFAFPSGEVARSVYLDFDEGYWIGPLDLIETTNGCYELAETHGDMILPCVKPAEEQYILKALGKISPKPKRFVRAEEVLLSVGETDWSSDEILLTQVMSRIGKVDVQLRDQLKVTKQIIDRMARDLVGRAQSSLLEQRRVHRAKRIVADAELVIGPLDGLEAELLNLPSIKNKVELILEKAQKEGQAKSETLIAKEITSRQTEIAAAESALQDVEGRLADRRRELDLDWDAQLDVVEASVKTRLAGILAQPAEELANIALIRAAVGPTPSAFFQAVAQPISEDSLPWSGSMETVTAFDGDARTFVSSVVSKEFKRRGLRPQVGRDLQAFFLAGLLPIFLGSEALTYLEAFAQCLSGGRYLWVPITPTLITPGDLLGKVNPSTGRFEPAANGLLDLLLAAGNSTGTNPLANEMHLVVLDGINRASVENYLLPLLTCYAGQQGTINPRRLSLAHSSLLSAKDPYRSVSSLQWPNNVLLAATVSDGLATLPLPTQSWDQAGAVIPIQYPCPEELDENEANSESAQSVSHRNWAAWQEDFKSDLPKAAEILGSQPDLPVAARQAYQRFCAARLVSRVNREEQQQSLILSCLLPYYASAGLSERVNELLRSLPEEGVQGSVERILPLLERIKQ